MRRYRNWPGGSVANESAQPERISLIAEARRAMSANLNGQLTFREELLLGVIERREKERLARLDAVLERIQRAASTSAARPWVMELREALR